MKVGDSVRLAINSYEDGELDAAMIHACHAIDGTSKKAYPTLSSGRPRFTAMIRKYIDIFGAWAAPGINLADTRLPVRMKGTPTTPDGLPDVADVIYSIRCAHDHGDELPDGFAFVPYQTRPDGRSSLVTITIVNGSVRLSDLTIMGLCMVAVAAPDNTTQQIPPDYYTEFGGRRLPIRDLWGKEQELRSLIATFPVPPVKLDFGDWMIGK